MNFTGSEFFNTLGLQNVKFWLETYEMTSGTEQGDRLVAWRAFPKWRAEVTLVPADMAENNRVSALLEDIGTFNTFDMWNPYAEYAKEDPTGSVTVASINSVSSSEISLSVANGYVVTKGDMFEVTYGSNPTRKALFRAQETVTSSGGATPAFRVTPPPKPGITNGDTVDLTRPAARMALLSYDVPSADGAITQGITFSAIEVGR